MVAPTLMSSRPATPDTRGRGRPAGFDRHPRFRDRRRARRGGGPRPGPPSRTASLEASNWTTARRPIGPSPRSAWRRRFRQSRAPRRAMRCDGLAVAPLTRGGLRDATGSSRSRTRVRPGLGRGWPVRRWGAGDAGGCGSPRTWCSPSSAPGSRSRTPCARRWRRARRGARRRPRAGACCALAAGPGPALALLCAAALLAGGAWGGARLAATRPPDLDLPTAVRGTVVLDTPPVPDGARWAAGPRDRRAPRCARAAAPVPPGTRLLLDLDRPGAPARRWARACGWRGRLPSAARPDARRAGGARWLGRQGIAARLRPETVRRGGAPGRPAGACATAGGSGPAATPAAGLGGEPGGDRARDGPRRRRRDCRRRPPTTSATPGSGTCWPSRARTWRWWRSPRWGCSGRSACAGAPAVAGAGALMRAYCLACDGGASVARAGIVGGLGLLAELRSSPRERWYLMLVGLAVLLAHQPRALEDPGPAALVRRRGRACSCWRRPLARLARRAGCPRGSPTWPALAAAASLATAPVVVWHFGRLSLAGLALNVVAVPLAAPIVVLALAGLAAGAVVPAAGVAWPGWRGSGPGRCCWPPARPRRSPGRRSTCRRRPPRSSSPWSRWCRWRLWAVDPPGRLGAARRGRSPGAPGGGASALAVAAGVGARPGPRHRRPGRPRAAVTVLDIGQGDAILLRSPDGRRRGVRHRPAGRARRRWWRRSGAPGVRRLDAAGADPRLARPRRRRARHPRALAGGRRCCSRPTRSTAGCRPRGRSSPAARARGVPVRRDPGGVAPAPRGRWRLRVLSPAGARPVGADPNPYSLVALASVGLAGRAADRRRRERRAGARW